MQNQTQLIKTDEPSCLIELYNLLNDNINPVYLENYQLSLTPEFLSFFASEFSGQRDDPFTSNSESPFSFLQSTFKKFNHLIVTSRRYQTIKTIKLNHFPSIYSLTLFRINPQCLLNLEQLRKKLKALQLKSCFNHENPPENFFRYGGVWPLLHHLSVTSCKLRQIDVSLVPNSIRSLDLSWNRLSIVDIRSLPYLAYLDLSCNCLVQLPAFDQSDLLANSLKVLRLGSNRLVNVNNIGNLRVLTELDIASNCIIDRRAFLNEIAKCSSLISLNILENPIWLKKNFAKTLIDALPSLAFLNGYEIPNRGFITILSNTQPSPKLTAHRVFDSSVSLETDIPDESDVLSESVLVKKIATSKVKKSTKKVTVHRDPSASEGDTKVKSKQQKILTESLREGNFMNSENLDYSGVFAESDKEAEKMAKTADEQSQQKVSAPIEQGFKHNWTDEDAEDSDNMFLVENQNGQGVFLFIKDSIIYEKDGITGDLLSQHDLNSLYQVKQFIDTLRMELFFKTRIPGNERINYLFEDEETLEDFSLRFTEPYLQKYMYQQRRTESQQKKENFLKCLRCGYNKVTEAEALASKCPKCKSDFAFSNNFTD